jgi:NhaP-type Na+/H+ or K+/H+ antiporter
MARSFALAFGITLVSLGIGMAGYHGFEGLSWLDAFLNAAMILSGMGPVARSKRPPGSCSPAATRCSAGWR